MQRGRGDCAPIVSRADFVLALSLSLLLTVAAVIIAVARHIPAAAAANPAYLPQPGRSGTWLGDRVFTESQFEILARNYGIVVLNPNYADYDISRHLAAAKHLVRLNRGVRVYEYYQALFRDVGNAAAPGHIGWGSYASGFKADWSPSCDWHPKRVSRLTRLIRSA